MASLSDSQQNTVKPAGSFGEEDGKALAYRCSFWLVKNVWQTMGIEGIRRAASHRERVGEC